MSLKQFISDKHTVYKNLKAKCFHYSLLSLVLLNRIEQYDNCKYYSNINIANCICFIGKYSLQ